MKITVETDHGICQDDHPCVHRITIEREIVTISEMVDMFSDLLLGMGYRFKGRLGIVEDEDGHED